MTMQSVPEDLVDLSKQVAETQSGEEQAASLLTCLFARLCNILASSKGDVPSNPMQIITDAIALDDDLVAWSSNLPVEYEYSRKPAEPFSKAYADYCDVYGAVFNAQVWNIYRSARLGANGIIVGGLHSMQAHQVDSNDTESLSSEPEHRPVLDLLELGKRFDVLESLRNDFCAAMPFLLDRHSQARATSSLPLCYRTPVIHQLAVITRSPGVSERMCSWAMGQIAELQCDEEVDQGGIWMNTSQSKIKI